MAVLYHGRAMADEHTITLQVAEAYPNHPRAPMGSVTVVLPVKRSCAIQRTRS
jgi:hypothetical protein